MTRIVSELNKLKKSLLFLSRKIYAEFTANQIAILLEVAEHEKGITMRELVEETRIPQGSVSRNIKTLSTYFQPSKGDPEVKETAGLGLLHKDYDMENPRCVLVTLTPKGESVVDSIKAAMGDNSED